MPEASSEYFAILTNRGTEKLAAYLQSGEKITISYVLVGDGNGSIPMPDPTRTALVHEVWRGPAETVLNKTKMSSRLHPPSRPMWAAGT